MKETALKKSKNHRLLILKQVKAHIVLMKANNSDYSNFDEAEIQDPSAREKNDKINYESEFSAINYLE